MTRSPIPPLDELVAAIESKAADPLQQLSAAVLVGVHIDQLGDHLVGHFVDKAREAGASWSTIGQSLGVTKQAAQKRFVPTSPADAEADPAIFARYTDHARKVVVGAQAHAQARAAAEIRPGDLLLALLDDAEALFDGVDTDAVRAAVSDALGTGTGPAEGAVPFAPASKKAMALGHREALRRNDEQIEPRHLLLGVLSMTDEPDVAAATARGLDRAPV
jgi:hypothetical protein